ncbi:MAG TPA: hypothetical protein VH374_07360 [Polyangia bacterium]|nr:hypothetical protein [Polyangia bacterium]
MTIGTRTIEAHSDRRQAARATEACLRARLVGFSSAATAPGQDAGYRRAEHPQALNVFLS